MQKNYFFLFFSLIAFFQNNDLKAQDFKTIGYLPYYRFGLVDDIEFEKLTHLNIAFANPDSQGNLSVGGQDIDPIVDLGHDYGLEVYISIAGGLTTDWVTYWMNLLQPNNRTAYIHKIINFTMEHNLEGVDVDLEWSNVTENYSGFVLELKDSLTAHGLGMTAALPGTYRYPNISDNALDAFDWINMMVYDYRGPWDPDNAGQHSSYQNAVSSIDYWSNTQGVSTDRLTLGVPFYGYDFSNSNNVHSFTYASMVAIDTDYADVDQVGQAYYNGRPTIGNKTDLALTSVSGIMIWELGQDALGLDSEYSLLETIYQRVSNYFVGTDDTRDIFSPLVYPNPFRNSINIEQLEFEDINIQLSTIEGRVLFNKKIDDAQFSTSIPTDQLNSGFYILSITDGNNVKSYKLVKH